MFTGIVEELGTVDLNLTAALLGADGSRADAGHLGQRARAAVQEAESGHLPRTFTRGVSPRQRSSSSTDALLLSYESSWSRRSAFTWWTSR